MALQKFIVRVGYQYFFLNSTGQRVKAIPAGGAVELPDIEFGEQSWKLEPVKEGEEVTPPPNDLALIEGVKGSDGKVNEKLLEFFEDEKITTFRQVAEMDPKRLMEEVKGIKKEMAAKMIASAFQLAGLG